MRLKVTAFDPSERIDSFIPKKTSISRSQVKRLIEAGGLAVNGRPVKANYKVRAGDEITFEPIRNEPGSLLPEDIDITVLYEDTYLAVVEKPPGMVVYPAFGHTRGTLMNALAGRLKRLASVGGPLRPGVVHRLDKDTSGVMVIALEDKTYQGLVKQFGERAVKRTYTAILYGRLKADEGRIELPIGRSTADRKKMSTRSGRKRQASTGWRVKERFQGATLVAATLGTGRTHQIRVHFAAVGHPVCGDRTYGGKTFVNVGNLKVAFPRQMLHAGHLGFEHPQTGKYMEFSSPVPPDMENVLEALRGASAKRGAKKRNS